LTKEIAIPITFHFSDNSKVGHYMTGTSPHIIKSTEASRYFLTVQKIHVENTVRKGVLWSTNIRNKTLHESSFNILIRRMLKFWSTSQKLLNPGYRKKTTKL